MRDSLGSGTMALMSFVASALVFALIRVRRVDPGDSDSNPLTEADLQRLVAAGRKIDAIRLYRRLHGVGLKTAKEAVERMIVRRSREK